MAAFFNIETSTILNNITFVNSVGTINPIDVQFCSVNILNCNFENCTRYYAGSSMVWGDAAGIIVVYSTYFGLNNMVNCTFNNCSLYKTGSTDISAGVILAYASNFIIDNCRFNENSITDTGRTFGGGVIRVIGPDISTIHMIMNSRFTNNHVKNSDPNNGNGSGGAIFIDYVNKVMIDNCTFENNSAIFDGGAIKVGEGCEIVDISSCNFINNSADKEAGAIKWEGALGTVKNCNFTSNHAPDSGAIKWTGKSGNVSGSIFFNNSASNDAGAIKWEGALGTVKYCNFISNSAYNAGAVKWFGESGTLVGSKFTSNNAFNDAGALTWEGDSGKITDSSFDNNTAVSGGGALYLTSSDAHIDVSNSNFTANKVTGDYGFDGSGGAISADCDSADISECIFENNTASKRAGAIYIFWLGGTISNCNFTNNNATESGGAICVFDSPVTVSGSSFKTNNADEGGAIYLESDDPEYITDIEITDETRFDGNIAFRGSAIFIDKLSKLSIRDAKFGKNRANSSNIKIDVKPVNYYPGNTTLNITFKGNDNIANAIWNDGDLNHVLINRITYEAFIDGNLFNKTVESEDVAIPISLSDVTDYYAQIWQDDLENAQLINVSVSPIVDSTLGAGLLGAPANQVGEPVYSSTHLTDVHGDVVIPFENLGAGIYQVYAEHLTDMYYTQKSNTYTFEIINALNVTKVSVINWTDVNDPCDFIINITNNCSETLGNITVIENIPSGFSQEYFYPRIQGYSPDYLIVNGNKITYSGVLAPKESLVIVVSLYAEKVGKYNNTIVVSSNLTNPLTVVSDEVTVYNSSINLTKTAVNSTVFIGNQAVFVINITNTGDRPIMPEEWLLIEDYDYDEGLVYNHIENVTGSWFADAGFPTFFLNSTLNVNESASFRIYFNTTKLGEFNNTAITNYRSDLEATDTVNVVKIPTETVVGNVSGYPDDTVTIPVNVTSEDGIPFNGQVNVTLPNGTVEVVDIVKGSGAVPWTIPHDFGEGDYPVNASFAGNYTHLLSNGTGTVTVEKIPTHISIENVTARPGDDVNVSVNVTADDGVLFNGNISVTLPDGKNVPVEIVNGEGIVPWTVPDDYDGVYPVNASFKGEGRYLPSNATGTVNVIPKIPTEIAVGNVTARPGDDVNVSVNVTADDGVLFNGNISVTLPDGKNVPVEIVNGEGIVPWTVPDDFGEGDYPVNASFEGNNLYLPSNATGIVTVIPKIPTEIAVGNVTVHPGDDVNISVDVTADDDVPFNGEVTVILPNGSNQTVVIVNGIGNATWTVPDDFGEGDYPVNATFDGDNNYLPSNGTGVVTVEKISTHISVDDVTAKSGNEVTVSFNVTADDGSLFNDEIVVTLPDGSNKTVEVVNGAGDVTFNVPEDAGDYDLTVSFKGDNKYSSSYATATVSVIPKTSVEINIPDIVAYPDDEVSIPISVTTDDGSLFNGNVVVTLPDGSNTTVEIVNGSTIIDLTVPDNAGNYSICVTFDGDDDFLPSKGTCEVTVEKIRIEISVGNVTAHSGDDINIPVDVIVISDETSDELLMITADIIISAGDENLFNGNLTVTLPDGSTQNVEIIDGKGNIAWTIPVGYEGDYPVTASFEGNNIYLSANSTGIITVEKIPTEISLENITAKPGEEITIPIDVATEDNIPVNGNVTVELPDGTNKTVEVVNGTGETTWTVPDDYAGDYNYSVKYDGNDLYLPSNNTAIIAVAPKVPVKVIVGNITAKPGDNISIPIDVIPEDGSVFNGIVTVTLPDGTTKVVEIINGKGSVDWTIPGNYNGTYQVTVTFDGDDTYLAANATGFITAIPDTPVAPEKTPVKEEVPMDTKATGNPLAVLLMVLALLGIGIKRKN